MGALFGFVFLGAMIYFLVKFMKKNHVLAVKGFKLGYVIEGKNPFTGVSLGFDESKNKSIGVIKESDYTTLYFYKLSETVKETATGMGTFTEIVDTIRLDQVVRYEKQYFDAKYTAFILEFIDGSSCTIKAFKDESITNTFEKRLYMLTH